MKSISNCYQDEVLQPTFVIFKYVKRNQYEYRYHNYKSNL